MADWQPRRVSRLKNNRSGMAVWVRGACDKSGGHQKGSSRSKLELEGKDVGVKSRAERKDHITMESGERGKRQKVAVMRPYKISYG